MLSLDQYTAAQRRIYNQTIRGAFGGYDMKVTVQILTNNHAVVSTVSNVLMDGQVDVDVTDKTQPSRKCLLQFLDPGHSLAFDSSAPTDGALYLDRMIRVIVSVRCSFGWVDVPVFTGPVTGVDRDGDLVNVNAAGKETFGLRSAWETHTFKSGRKWAVVVDMLTRTGEQPRYMQIPTTGGRIVKAISIGRETQLWVKAVNVEASRDRILLCDARGIARSVAKTSKPVATFDGSNILSEPQISFSTDNLKNAIIVVGADPDGPKKPVSALVVAPRSHPLSPWKIGRGTQGRGGYLTFREDNSHIRTTPKAVARGQALLVEYLSMQTQATWDALPIWHLDGFDTVNLATETFSATVQVKKFSLPLRADANMTCGYQRDLRKPRRLMRSAA